MDDMYGLGCLFVLDWVGVFVVIGLGVLFGWLGLGFLKFYFIFMFYFSEIP